RAYFIRVFARACDALDLKVGEVRDGRAELLDAEGRGVEVSLGNLFSMLSKHDRAEWSELTLNFLNAGGPAAIDRIAEITAAGLQANKDKLLPCLKPESALRESSDFWSHSLCRRDAAADAVALALRAKLTREEAARRVREDAHKLPPNVGVVNLMMV